MTTRGWQQLVLVIALVVWAGCARAWADIGEPGADVVHSFVWGTLIVVPAAIVTWARSRARRSAERAYAALDPEGRQVVDDALDAGELRGPIVLRYLQRDLAKARLEATGPATGNLLWLALLIAFLLVPVVGAPRHPLGLVLLSVVDTLALAVLVWLDNRGPRISDDERRRLKALTKAPLTR